MNALLALWGCGPAPDGVVLAPSREERVERAVGRGLSAIDARTLAEDVVLRLDVPIGLSAIRTYRPQDPLVEALLTRAVGRLDQGGDPRRRFWDPASSWPADQDYTWVPVAGKVVSPNFALVEALYCTQHPLRPETVAWTCGTLRDDGGRMSGHAAWILQVAVEQGCVPRGATCLDALRDELVAASRRPPDLGSTDGRDLFAEVVLFGTLAGATPLALAPAVDTLVDHQDDSGSFGSPGDDSFPALHATVAATWALAAWQAASDPGSSGH